MRVLVWLVEGTLEGCLDAARPFIPAGAEVTLLHVIPDDVSEFARGVLTGLLGRALPDREGRAELDTVLRDSARELVEEAAARLGLPALTSVRTGRVEREVVTAAEGADLLLVARDGDTSRLGPRSLGHETRFVVDHAPCSVLLVWPHAAPSVTSIPSPPTRRPRNPPIP